MERMHYIFSNLRTPRKPSQNSKRLRQEVLTTWSKAKLTHPIDRALKPVGRVLPSFAVAELCEYLSLLGFSLKL